MTERRLYAEMVIVVPSNITLYGASGRDAASGVKPSEVR